MQRARELGCQRVVLSSADAMRVAHHVYRRMGFVRLPERDWLTDEGTWLLAYALELQS